MSEPSAPAPPTFGHVPWPVRPSPGINYNFICGMYLAGSAMALFFYTLEKHLLAPLLEDDNADSTAHASSSENNSDISEGDGSDEEGGDPWKEFAKGLEGMHLIFAPFIPCLLWSVVVRFYWMRETSRASQEKKDK